MTFRHIFFSFLCILFSCITVGCGDSEQFVFTSTDGNVVIVRPVTPPTPSPTPSAQPPVITDVSFTLPVDISTILSSIVVDPQNLPLSFVWTIGGIRNIQGPETDLSSWTWTPAGLPGVYNLMLEVTNSLGLTSRFEAQITVSGVHPWPNRGRDAQNSGRSNASARQGLANNAVTLDDEFVEVSSPTIASDGTVYLGTFTFNSGPGEFESNLSILPNGTTPITEVPLPTSFTRSTPTIAPDGTVFIGSYNFEDEAFLSAFDPDQSTLSSFALQGYGVEASSSIGLDGTVYIGSFDDDTAYLNILRPGQATASFILLSGNAVFTTPGFAPDGTLYICSDDGDQTFLNILPPGATEVTSLEMPGEFAESDPAINSEGTVYCGSYDETSGIAYLNIFTPGASSVTSITVDGAFSDSSPAFSSDGTVNFITVSDTETEGFLHRLDPEGTLLETVDLPGATGQTSSPAMTNDDTLYVTTYSGAGVELCVVPSQSSTPTTVALPGDAAFSSVALGADGTVYVATFEEFVDAFLCVLR